MNREEFLQFVRDVRKASDTGDAIQAKLYLSSVDIGATNPSWEPPRRDNVAIEGYELGRRLVEDGETFK